MTNDSMYAAACFATDMFEGCVRQEQGDIVVKSEELRGVCAAFLLLYALLPVAELMYAMEHCEVEEKDDSPLQPPYGAILQ